MKMSDLYPVQVDYVGKHEPREDYNNIPLWRFNDQLKGCCPYCKTFIRFKGTPEEFLLRREGFAIYRCSTCGGLFKEEL